MQTSEREGKIRQDLQLLLLCVLPCKATDVQSLSKVFVHVIETFIFRTVAIDVKPLAIYDIHFEV